MVIIKFLDFRKGVDPNVHVRVFSYVIKANVETSKEYTINAFSFTLRNITSYWCHNLHVKNYFTVLFQSLHMHFANIIKRFKMMSKYTWS
jgi:hypothetical protein